MDTNIGILHLSDFHICSQNEIEICELLKSFFMDVDKMCLGTNIVIKLVCITGDLINNGNAGKEELELALEKIILPLLEHLGLNEESLFIVPGNHEIKQDLIDKYTEEGLSRSLITTKEIETFLKKIEPNCISRVSYFKEFESLVSGSPIYINPLCSCYCIKIQGLTMGIACVNSAWRSSGKGVTEKGKMIVGKKQITDCLNAIKETDIKICLMHHPLDWIIDCDKFDVERCINNFDIVLNGHIHTLDTKTYNSFNGQTIFNTCGKFDLSSDIYNGYSLLSINPNNYQCDVYLRQYHDYPRSCFDKAIHLCKEGKYSAKLDVKDEIRALSYEIVNEIRNKFFAYTNSYLVENVVEGNTSKTFDELFVTPTINRFSEYEKETMLEEEDYTSKKEKDNGNVCLETVCNSKNNLLIYGKKEIGKTTLLHFFAKYYLSNFHLLGKVPIIIDFASKKFVSLKSIEKATQNFILDYSADSYKISLKQIEHLLSKGTFVIMFDNFERITDKELDKINELISKYQANRFIFSTLESISNSVTKNSNINNLACEYKKLYMRSISKHQIRIMTGNLLGSNGECT